MGPAVDEIASAKTWSSTALMRAALLAKWCWTSPRDTPAAAATERSEVPDVPCVAKLLSAASRMRSTFRGSSGPVRSDSDLTRPP
jgi:hypothetical protein